MPVWLMRLLWRLRGKRRARLHLQAMAESVEGILVGRWGGHYHVLNATLIRPGGTEPMKGFIEVPAERVLFIQVEP